MKENLSATSSDEEKTQRQKTIGFILRNARESAGLSINALGRTVEFSPAYILRIERGEVPASARVLKAVADTLNYSRFEFLEAAGHIWLEDASPEEREVIKDAIDTGKFNIK